MYQWKIQQNYCISLVFYSLGSIELNEMSINTTNIKITRSNHYFCIENQSKKNCLHWNIFHLYIAGPESQRKKNSMNLFSFGKHGKNVIN